MKNFIFYLLSGVILTFSSCSNEAITDEINSEISQTELRVEISKDVLNMQNVYEKITNKTFKSRSEEKNIFNTLGDIEKVNLYKYKLLDFSRTYDLNQKQIKLIEELYVNLKDNSYKLDSEENNKFQNYVSNWISLAELEFTSEQMYFIGASLKNKSSSIKGYEFQEETIKGYNDCDCNTDSRYTCGRITGYIMVEYGECGGTGCETSVGGCGFAFASYCNGSTCSY